MLLPPWLAWKRLACLSLGLVWVFGAGPGLAVPEHRGAALIQERGTALQGGQLTGGSQMFLERAEGGDTPVLTFSSDFGLVRLLLDTGAASAMVSPALIRRLGLGSRPLPPDIFSLAGGGADCQSLKLFSTRLPELRLPSGGPWPPLRLHGLEALVIPAVALPKGVDGVLGVPSLKQLPFVVDPLEGRVLFGPPAQQWRRAMASSPEVLPLVWRRGVPLLPLRLRSRSDGQVRELPALADTGAEGLFLTAPLAATLTPLEPAQSARLIGACGQQEVLRQRLLWIGLGSHSPPIQTVEAILTSNPVFALLDVQAIVGQELLRSRRQFWRLEAAPARLELW